MITFLDLQKINAQYNKNELIEACRKVICANI